MRVGRIEHHAFQKGSIHAMVFVEDGGRVTELREIRKYDELVMTRVPD